MKKNNTVSLLSLLALLILPLLWTSCSEETDTVEEFPNWQARNTAYWDSLYTNTQAKSQPATHRGRSSRTGACRTP